MATEPNISLKPCPFCGGEANGDGYIRYNRPLADTQWADGSEITEAFYVNCIKCGIDNGRSGLVGGYQTKAEAIAQWNTRTTPDPKPSNELVEQLVVRLTELAIMELDADEENSLQINAWSEAAEKEILAALSAIGRDNAVTDAIEALRIARQDFADIETLNSHGACDRTYIDWLRSNAKAGAAKIDATLNKLEGK